MLDVHKLEKRWFNYRLKRIFSPILGFSALTFVLGGSYYYTTINGGEFSLFSKAPTLTRVLGVTKEANLSDGTQPTMDVSSVQAIKKEEKKKPNLEVEELSLEPIIPIIDMEKEEKIKAVHKTVKSTKRDTSLVRAKANNYLTAKELAVITKVERVQKVQPHVTKKMKFQSTTVNYIETIKQKFSKSNKPREALLLAKAYYKDGKYKASEKWALTANKLDNSLAESWFIFAKSKVKLGKKREALKILVSYYKKNHSSKAKELIGQIKIGKI